MKKVIGVFLVALLSIAAAIFVPASAGAAKFKPKAQIAQSGCTSHTYLHLECATHAAFGWVEYDCCRVLGRQNYDRANANRVDIDVRAYRGGRSQCRWVIVRGHDFSKYSYYHPDRAWRNC